MIDHHIEESGRPDRSRYTSYETWYVTGGKYKDTNFDQISEGHKLETFGPFNSYEKAKVKWSEVTWKFVDDCHVKYQIVNK